LHSGSCGFETHLVHEFQKELEAGVGLITEVAEGEFETKHHGGGLISKAVVPLIEAG
jgi:hypothetical protein